MILNLFVVLLFQFHDFYFFLKIAEEIIANSPTEEAGHKARLALMIGKAKFNDFKGMYDVLSD